MACVLCCGAPEFHEKLNLLEQKYPFGSRKDKEFVFTGLRIKQYEDYSIKMDQTQYVKDASAISLNRVRRSQSDEPIDENERQKLRPLIGSLQRPDLGSRLSFLQSHIHNGQEKHLIEANKTLHDAKVHADVHLTFQPIPVEDIRFVAFPDASYASEKNRNSHHARNADLREYTFS